MLLVTKKKFSKITFSGKFDAVHCNQNKTSSLPWLTSQIRESDIKIQYFFLVAFFFLNKLYIFDKKQKFWKFLLKLLGFELKNWILS